RSCDPPIVTDGRYIKVALPGCPLLRLHDRLHAFENHRIFKRHEVVEGCLIKRVFAEESEYPLRTDLLAARDVNVLSRQVLRRQERSRQEIQFCSPTRYVEWDAQESTAL